jgi:hypothetical protein
VRARRARRRPGQAVIETAIVIPIMLFLITGFIGLMIQVELQQQLDAATKLAAESTFQAPRDATDNGGPTAGEPTRCRYAVETFEGTMSFFFNTSGTDPASNAYFYGGRLNNPYLSFTQKPECKTSTAGYDPAAFPPQTGGNNRNSDIQCEIDAQDPKIGPPGGGGIHVTICTTDVKLDFGKTPLAWAVFWAPSLTSRAEAVPPPFRQ